MKVVVYDLFVLIIPFCSASNRVRSKWMNNEGAKGLGVAFVCCLWRLFWAHSSSKFFLLIADILLHVLVFYCRLHLTHNNRYMFLMPESFKNIKIAHSEFWSPCLATGSISSFKSLRKRSGSLDPACSYTALDAIYIDYLATSTSTQLAHTRENK